MNYLYSCFICKKIFSMSCNVLSKLRVGEACYRHEWLAHLMPHHALLILTHSHLILISSLLLCYQLA